MSSNKLVAKIKIFRYDPKVDEKPRYEIYEVPYERGARVLELLLYIRERLGVDVAFRYACRSRICGQCGMLMNKKPILACWEEARPEMTLEPLPGFPIIRDLVIDRSAYDEYLYEVYKSYINAIPKKDIPETVTVESFKKLEPSKMSDVINAQRCIECLLCISACPIFASSGSKYSGAVTSLIFNSILSDPRVNTKSIRLISLNIEKDLLRCHYIYQCRHVCPVGLNTVSFISKLRSKLLYI
jgi:succinate dehydrogenase/fumarate reductase iron-sulfur protein